jgi:hypothetical protein
MRCGDAVFSDGAPALGVEMKKSIWYYIVIQSELETEEMHEEGASGHDHLSSAGPCQEL